MAQVMATGANRLKTIRSTTSAVEFGKLIKMFPNRTNVVADGDSWFAYPRKNILTGGANNIIAHLKKRRRFNLLQLSSNGDEAVSMLSGGSKLKLLDVLERRPVDFLLFSGGGNDIVGRYDFEFFLKDMPAGTHWKRRVDWDRFERRLSRIHGAYVDLADFCDDYSSNNNIRIITHTYDHAIPSPKGAVFLGGLVKIGGGRLWMHPYLINHGIDDPADQRAIVKEMMDRLAKCLLKIQRERPERFLVADTRGTIAENGWLNEIHPKPAGFAKLADKLLTKMKPFLPA